MRQEFLMNSEFRLLDHGAYGKLMLMQKTVADKIIKINISLQL